MCGYREKTDLFADTGDKRCCSIPRVQIYCYIVIAHLRPWRWRPSCVQSELSQHPSFLTAREIAGVAMAYRINVVRRTLGCLSQKMPSSPESRKKLYRGTYNVWRVITYYVTNHCPQVIVCLIVPKCTRSDQQKATNYS